MFRINRSRTLHRAIETGSLKAVQLLIENQANLNVQDEHGNTALHLVIKRNQVDLAQLLIESNADLNIQGQYNNTALHLAIERNLVDLVQLLIKNNADLNIQGQYNNTALHLAIKKDLVNLAQLLIENNADLNVQDEHGNAALHLATERNLVDLVQLLIKNNADLNIKGQYNNTVLHVAIGYNLVDLAQLLIKNSVDLNVQDKYGNTALHLAVEKNLVDLVQLLIESNADLNVKNEDGNTALHLAVEKNLVDLVQLLIESNADLNIQGKYNNTALHLAIECNLEYLAQLLIKNNADLNVKDRYHNTVLLMAAYQGHDNLVKEMVKANADLSVTDIHNGNILTHYCYQPQMIEFLMFHGVDYDLFRTALSSVLDNHQSSHDIELISKIYSYFMDDNTRISLKLEEEDNDKYTANLKDTLKAIIINNKNLEFKNLFLELVKQKLEDCKANVGQGDSFIEYLLKASKSKYSILAIQNHQYTLHELINQFKDFIFSEDSVQYFNHLIENAARINDKLQAQRTVKIDNTVIETNLIIPLIQRVSAKQNDSTGIMNRLLIELIDAATTYTNGISSCIKGILNKLATTIIDCIEDDNDQAHIFPFEGYMVNYNQLLTTVLKLDKDKKINPTQELNELDAQHIRSLIYRIIKTDIVPNEEFVKIVYYGESENVFHNKDNITQFRILLTHENLSKIQQKILVKNTNLKYKIPEQFLPCLGDNHDEISYMHNVSDKMLLQNIIANLHDLADDNEKSYGELITLINLQPEKLNISVAYQLQGKELLTYLGNTYNKYFYE